MEKMTREMALKIIEDEKLTNYHFFDGKGISSDEIVILKKDEKWIVFATSERGGMVTNSDFVYDNEEEALDSFIRRLRVMNASIRRRYSEYHVSEVSEVSAADREKIKQQRIAGSYGKAVGGKLPEGYRE